MTPARRVLHILIALLTLLSSAGMLFFPQEGYLFVILFLDISLFLYGLRLLVYYLTMARFMTGGIMTFYKSIIAIDFSLFVCGLDQVPQKYAMLYLLACFAFSGLVDILRSLEARRLEAPWRAAAAYGGGKLVTVAVCLFFLDSIRVLTLLFSLGLIHSALLRVLNACRRTAAPAAEV